MTLGGLGPVEPKPEGYGTSLQRVEEFQTAGAIDRAIWRVTAAYLGTTEYYGWPGRCDGSI